MNYRLTEHADNDLIHTYIEGIREFGIRQADAYHERLEKTFLIIADNPKMVRLRMEIVPPVRIYPCGSHMIIYEIDELGVLILRVRHYRENWTNNPL